MATPTDRLFVVADQVLAALESFYPAAPDSLALPERRYVSDGTPAYDCEQVAVQVARTMGILGNVAAEQAMQVLGPMVQRAAEVVVHVIRCAPVVDDDGSAPSTDEVEASARGVLADAVMVPDALLAAYKAGLLGACSGVALGGWAGYGPEGGLVGGLVTVRLDLAVA